MSKRVLAVNCGSSSFKYALFDATKDAERVVERRAADEIGDHVNALRSVLRDLMGRNLKPDVVGHRIVHGGPSFDGPTRVSDEALRLLDRLVPLAPLHLPAEIAVVRAIAAQWPDVPQVMCFDTTFHRDLPEIARRYPLPSAVLGSEVRRYGFHGLSYEYVVSALGKDLKPKTILAHLGSGASMVALRDGRPIDTTMGFTPTGGLVMATRPGDLDPGLLLYLLKQGLNLSISALERSLQRESGMTALSETTGDVRILLAKRAVDPRAELALSAFCMSARKWIGALAATLGGLDALVFTGGIGENAAALRAEIATGLSHLGIDIDAAKNDRNEEGAIGSANCDVRMVHTDEDRIVARHALGDILRRS